jgi:hypothetical protein
VNVKTESAQSGQTTRREPLTRDRIIEVALRVMDADAWTR